MCTARVSAELGPAEPQNNPEQPEPWIMRTSHSYGNRLLLVQAGLFTLTQPSLLPYRDKVL